MFNDWTSNKNDKSRRRNAEESIRARVGSNIRILFIQGDDIPSLPMYDCYTFMDDKRNEMTMTMMATKRIRGDLVRHLYDLRLMAARLAREER